MEIKLNVTALVEHTFTEQLGVTFDHIVELIKAEHDGRLVVLPCKVGDTIWTIENVFNGSEVVQMIVSRVIDEIKHNRLNQNIMISKKPFELHFVPSSIGREVFSSKEEAEAKLGEKPRWN